MSKRQEVNKIEPRRYLWFLSTLNYFHLYHGTVLMLLVFKIRLKQNSYFQLKNRVLRQKTLFCSYVSKFSKVTYILHLNRLSLFWRYFQHQKWIEHLQNFRDRCSNHDFLVNTEKVISKTHIWCSVNCTKNGQWSI